MALRDGNIMMGPLRATHIDFKTYRKTEKKALSKPKVQVTHNSQEIASPAVLLSSHLFWDLHKESSSKRDTTTTAKSKHKTPHFLVFTCNSQTK